MLLKNLQKLLLILYLIIRFFSSWSVLALYNLESFGKQIPNDDNRG